MAKQQVKRDFDTVLVANRGEIALRIMRTAHRMGLRTVAVYSTADANAPHVKYASDAVCIGAGPVGESYLVGAKIIEAAKQSGAQAIHPGYGFLSENAAFAKLVEDAGLIFVGPPVNAIDVMGDKARAKRAMIKAGVPCVPGYQGEDQSDKILIAEAAKIGFPVMVKAAAGGGGRGMRLVADAGGLPSALQQARSEATNAFGSGDLILEKAILRPRHVEIQVFADAHGNVIHLGERDCSVQRRHQKVIEEAPCPVMTSGLRAQMGAAAVAAASAVDYRGAGTIEFLLNQDGEFYFLEMNTRLQVEHPVTEEITGLDLVELQIRVARGEPLGISQADVNFRGHAIEVRLYAEDPQSDFLPCTGPITLWQVPAGQGIRVDSGYETGGEISPYYDPMIAKVVAHGATRDEARRRLIQALGRAALFGPKTNRDFLIDALGQSDFARGKATTAFIGETYGDGGFNPAPLGTGDLAIAAVLHYAAARASSRKNAVLVSSELMSWSSAGALTSVFIYENDGQPVSVTVECAGGATYRVNSGAKSYEITLASLGPAAARLTVGGRGCDVIYSLSGERTLSIATDRRSFTVTDISAGGAAGAEAASSGSVISPMHGLLLEIAVAIGDDVRAGQKLAVLEAMKMQHIIVAAIDGIITTINVKPGTQIAADELILEIKPASSEPQPG